MFKFRFELIGFNWNNNLCSLYKFLNMKNIKWNNLFFNYSHIITNAYTILLILEILTLTGNYVPQCG